MSFVHTLETAPVMARACKVCEALSRVEGASRAEYEAALELVTARRDDGHFAYAHSFVAEVFTREGHPVSEKTVRTHRRKGHDSVVQEAAS